MQRDSPQIKICGLRSSAAARACVEAGVNMIGLNFIPDSRRRISLEQAKELLPLLDSITVVALFQNQSREFIESITRPLGLRWIQLHGQESPQFCEQLKEHFFIIKALHKEQALDGKTVAGYAPFITNFLIDGRQPGSGKTWDWQSLAPFKGILAGRPLWLAGGINRENVSSIIHTVKPAGVDSSSGVERQGVQEPTLIMQFCREVEQSKGQQETDMKLKGRSCN